MILLVSDEKIRTFEIEFQRGLMATLRARFELRIVPESQLVERHGALYAPKAGQQFVLYSRQITELLYPITHDMLRHRLNEETEKCVNDWAKEHPPGYPLYLAEEPKAWLSKTGPLIVGGIYAAVGSETRRKSRRVLKNDPRPAGAGARSRSRVARKR